MDVVAVLLQIIMLLLIMSAGAYLSKRRVMTDPVIKGINQIVLQVALPAQIILITQKQYADGLLPGFFRTMLMAILLMVSFSVLFYALSGSRLSDKRRVVFAALSALPNAAYVGVPLVQAAYGDEGIIYLSAYIIAFNLVLWTLYQVLYAGSNGLDMKLLFNGGVIACVIGTLFFMLHVKLPQPFSSFISQLGGLTTPLSMLLLGARLSQGLQNDKLKDKALWTALAARLLIFPLGAYLILRLIGISGIELKVLVIVSAMPSAVAVQMFAEKYDKDYVLASQGVSLSLILCVATIPLLMLFLGL